MSTSAIAYLRVSGKSQVDGDGFPRQQAAVEAIAAKLGLTIVQTFQEKGVSGTTSWAERPAFMDMVAHIQDHPEVRTVLVENLTRLAREFVVQDGILLFLASKGIDLISADTGENVTEAVRSDPMKKALIQIQAVFSELEKSNLVRKLKVARERRRMETGRCEGVKPFGSLPGEAETLRMMLRLRKEGKTVRDVADRLNCFPDTYRTRNGRPWNFASVAKILARDYQNQPDEPAFQ
jgi:site-specific DNA recombinase